MKYLFFNFFQLVYTIFVVYSANAQKLPKIQQAGLFINGTIKIDGVPKELNGEFKAYNNATDVFYTMANNDDYLYLAIKTTDLQVIKKIIGGGITLAIHPNGKKTNLNRIAITYPVYDKKSRPSMMSIRELEMLNNGPLSQHQEDSIVISNDTKVRNLAKQIKIEGIKKIDSTISVYNEYGIKASSSIGQNLAYNYELAIDLKLLGFSTMSQSTFSYNIRINEVEQSGINMRMDASGNIESIDMSRQSMRAQPATDFWSEYTLMKK